MCGQRVHVAAVLVLLVAACGSGREYSAADYLRDIGILTDNLNTYTYPEFHYDFYKPEFKDAGVFGKYDFIVVGGGTAGAVVASRLSEVPSWRVLLIEGGAADVSPVTDIPGMAGLLQFTRYNWGYRSTPQRNACQAMVDRRCNLPRGKALGGSSLLNYMIYTRGSRGDYDAWAAQGHPGWAWRDVVPYFLKSENSSLAAGPDAPVDADRHRAGGPLHVEHVRHFGPLSAALLAANRELGRPTLDYNGHVETGYSRMQLNTRDGRRHSSFRAFLEPVLDRPNLDIVANAYVTKILFSKNNTRAYGVQFFKGGRRFQAFAKHDVVLSAGSIGSPHLLMLSGVGPAPQLQQHGIPVVRDLPVGKELGDHQFFFVLFQSNYTEPTLPLEEQVNEFMRGRGPLTAPANLQAVGFSDTRDPKSTFPDMEYMYSPSLSKEFLHLGIGLREDVLDEFMAPAGPGSFGAIMILQHPKSRGSVTLKSANPFDHPLVDINFFSEPEDVETLLRGYKDLLRTVRTDAMKKFNVSLPHNPISGCKRHRFGSDDYVRCSIRHMASTLYHHSGTCGMGRVVDTHLKVKGVKGLRVADASVIPFPLAAHTNAPAYMIGEKAADMIKKEFL